ncbi:hypothetical protein GGI42DRAFT_314311 [Trichoderma sp. SZMC 28013]
MYAHAPKIMLLLCRSRHRVVVAAVCPALSAQARLTLIYCRGSLSWKMVSLRISIKLLACQPGPNTKSGTCEYMFVYPSNKVPPCTAVVRHDGKNRRSLSLVVSHVRISQKMEGCIVRTYMLVPGRECALCDKTAEV